MQTSFGKLFHGIRRLSKMVIDFHTNKKNLKEVAIISSKCIRNKIVGFSTHLMKRIQKGPVIGISLKLQEEEKVRRMDFVPDESAIKTDRIGEEREPTYGFQPFVTKVPVVFDNPEEFVGDKVITSKFYI